jgi:hypothetical protein
MMLFGPGVKVVTSTNDTKAKTSGTGYPYSVGRCGD